MKPATQTLLPLFLLLTTLSAQPRKIIINQDCSGPGGSNMQTLLVLLQSPDVEVLGITVVSGDQWRDEEVARTLRLLEIIGRTEIPVIPGATYPLVRTHAESQFWQQRYGKVGYAGAWDDRWWHEPTTIPALAEGQPTTKPALGPEGNDDAIHFLLRTVRKYPHEVTIYEGGPMTNLALAISIDPEFPVLAKELVFMGGGLSPESDNPEFTNSPRHEFNFWFDPEAAHIVLRAPWKKITCTPVDISVKTKLTPEMITQIKSAGTPLALYVAKYFQPGPGNDYMWDELAAEAWLDPSIITRSEKRYMDVDIDHGAAYGNTLTWTNKDKPALPLQPVEVQLDLDQEKLYKMFIGLMTRH